MNGKNCIGVVLLSSTLAACGGGGGGTTTANLGGASSILAARSGSETYAGAGLETELAPLTTENHFAFLSLLFYSILESDEKADGYVYGRVWRPNKDSAGLPLIGDDGRPVAPPELSPDAIGDDLISTLEQSLRSQNRTEYGNAGTLRCGGGGNAVITGELDTNTSQGELNVQYSDCISTSGLFRRQGVAKVFVNKRDPTDRTFTDFTVSYEGLTVETDWSYFVYTGSQRVVRTLINGDYRKSLVETDLERNDQNTYTYLDSTKNAVDGQGQNISGRLCHGRHGCVDVSTKQPFNLLKSQGDIFLTGANNSKIHLYYDPSSRSLHTRIDGSGTGAYSAPRRL